MGPHRKNHDAPPAPAYPQPEPADYRDVVEDRHLEALSEFVADEFEDEDLEILDGPAW